MNTLSGLTPYPVPRDAFGLARIGASEHALRGIRYADGEGGATPGGDPTPGSAPSSTPPAPAPAPGAPSPAAPSNPTPGSAPSESLKFEELDPRTQTEIRRLREEAARHRTEKSAAEQRAEQAEEQKNKVLAALGLKPDGSEQDPDPAELEAALSSTRTDVERTKRENLVLRVGPALGANVDRLLDSRSFNEKLAGLKVDDREGVETLIREAVERDSTLKSAPAPAASSGGTQHTGNTPAGTRKSKEAALADIYGGRVLPTR